MDDLSGRWWSSVLAESMHDSFIVLDGEKYVGTSSICAARDEKMSGWGEIISIYLLPEYFGKRYAKPLLDYTIDALVHKEFNKICLWELNENLRAQKFYKKHGFMQNGDAATIKIGGKDLIEVRYIKHVL